MKERIWDTRYDPEIPRHRQDTTPGLDPTPPTTAFWGKGSGRGRRERERERARARERDRERDRETDRPTDANKQREEVAETVFLLQVTAQQKAWKA